ncbi:MAG TPA: hypothetical protein VFE24_01310 [Pirellulales bacterium]|jgi:hypothetical protein|nr:hypothetical protein [Pirellulales bacterium]
MTVITLDSVIVAEYPLYGVPADQIVADPKHAAEFLARVIRQLPKELRVDQATFNKRVLNLRRRGQANGGLPRLERDFNGRGPNNPR